MTCDYLSTQEYAALIAARYAWPEASRQLKLGFVPDGFRGEVAKAIIDFKARGTFYNWDCEEVDNFHVGQLVKLRELIVKMHLEKNPPNGGLAE